MVKSAIARQTSITEPTINSHSGGPKVLCAGLWRTGTSSLQAAFEEHLGLSPCLHGGHMVTSVEKLKLFRRLCFEDDAEVRRKFLAEWFERYQASTDLPGFAFVEDLVELYSDMKIILNKRSSAEAWLKSVKSSLEFYSSKTYLMIGFWDPYLYWHHQIYVGVVHLFYTRFGITKDQLFSTRTYEVHNDWVRDVARKHSRPLLEYEVVDGWGPLVEFLDVKAPKDSETGDKVAFPQSNESSEMDELRRYLIWKGLKAWAVVLSPVAVLIVALVVGFMLRH